MSLGYAIAVRAIPFLELLDSEERRLLEAVREARGGSAAESAAMDSVRQRLAQGISAFVRSLPTAVRNDANTSRAAAYALVGLADERILHNAAGGLGRWREQLLEYELYGSALAGQEIVDRARAASYGTVADAGGEGAVGAASLLAPVYLAVFRSGFEGSLRGDNAGLSSLTASLAETVGGGLHGGHGLSTGDRPRRMGLPTLPLAAVGVMVWLGTGFILWLSLTGNSLERADRAAERVAERIPAAEFVDSGVLDRSAGPSGLPPLDDPGFDGGNQ